MSEVVIAPFSNSDIRDWPAYHYEALIGQLVSQPTFQGLVRLIGTASQRLRANEIVRSHDSRHVLNDCGRLPWSEVVEKVRGAACVVANNSGIAHLAAYVQTPTVCVFSGAHARTEWRPIGVAPVLISRAIACSPCYLHEAATCPYDIACLREIQPSVVAEAVLKLLGG